MLLDCLKILLDNNANILINGEDMQGIVKAEKSILKCIDVKKTIQILEKVQELELKEEYPLRNIIHLDPIPIAQDNKLSDWYSKIVVSNYNLPSAIDATINLKANVLFGFVGGRNLTIAMHELYLSIQDRFEELSKRIDYIVNVDNEGEILSLHSIDSIFPKADNYI